LNYEAGYYAYGDPYSRYGCAGNGAPLIYKSPDKSSSSSSPGKEGGLSHAALLAIAIVIPVWFGLGFCISLIVWLCVMHKRRKENRPLNDHTMAAVPMLQGPAPVQHYGAHPVEIGNNAHPVEIGNNAPPVEIGDNAPAPFQAYGVVPERKALAATGMNDQASSLTVGERNEVISTHSSISRDSRSPGELQRREEELEARERIIEEMERERRAEELNARERLLTEREREIKDWDEQRRNSGPLP